MSSSPTPSRMDHAPTIVCPFPRFPNSLPPLDTSSSPSLPSSLNSSPSPPTDSDISFDLTPPLSPAPSVYSLTDSLLAASFKHIHGRAINAHSDVYMLPADEEEVHRLDTQHSIFRLLHDNSNYLGPVPQVLTEPPAGAPQKAILDLGTGTGTWAIQMAEEFPWAEVVGVDLAPIQGETGQSIPPNCRIEVDDINLGLEHFHAAFDVVHARHICAGIRDYSHLIHQISVALRPSGIALFFEADYRFFNAAHEPFLPSLALAAWAAAFERAVAKRGGNIGASLQIPEWCKQVTGETGESVFGQVQYQDVWIPATPWARGSDPTSRRALRIGTAIREDLRSFLAAGRPLLLADGALSAQAVDEMTRRAEQELDRADTELYVRGCYTWARKNPVEA